jgi:hypothetical protein
LIFFGGFSYLRATTVSYTLTGAQQAFISLSNNLIINGGSVLNGDVGVTNNVNIPNGKIAAYAQFPGTASFSGAVSCTSCIGDIAGGTIANDPTVSTAISDYNSLITTLTALSGATPVAVANGTTLTPGLYQATSFSLNNTTGLTLNAGGNSNAQFVIRVPSFNISGSASVNLINGAQPDNVIFLYTGTANLNWSTSGTLSGILLGATSNAVTFASTGNTVARIIMPNATVQFNNGGGFQPGAFPEPSTFGLVGLGLLTIVVKTRTTRSARGRDAPEL